MNKRVRQYEGPLSAVGMNYNHCREKVPASLRQAWIDQGGKLISFHLIDSDQLLKTTEPHREDTQK